MKHRLFAALVIILALTVSAAAYYRYRTSGAGAPNIATTTVDVGNVNQTVQATGTLEAVSTVQVGSQLSGRISALLADYNSVVRKGQVIARLDPSLFQAQADQAKATLARDRAQVERARAQRQDAQRKLSRAKELASNQLIAASDLDAAQSTFDAADADLKSAQADVVQAQASLSQAQVNLEHAVIQSPIDGIVISRSVDVGQTVAATMQAPTLFVIANDLSRMQVNASIDEADIGVIRPQQPVRFKVDAFPEREFTGKVVQVRLEPTVVQNVTTYVTVIEVPNPELALKPGMTAAVTIDVARRNRVLRVAAAALRFTPTPETFAALGQAVPAEAAQARRVRTGGSAAPNTGSQPRPAASPERATADWRDAPSIDAMNAPLEVPTRAARVWALRDGQLVPLTIQVGLSDGVHVEIKGGVQEGTELVTGVTASSGTSASASNAQNRSPLLPQFPRRSGGTTAGRGR
jgi:HlyD family secretion protein